MRAQLSVFLGLTTLLAPAASQACRPATQSFSVIEAEYVSGRIGNVVSAEITAIGDQGQAEPGALAWEAKAIVLETLFGPELNGSIGFSYNRIVVICGNHPSLLEAEIGDKVVIYVLVDDEGNRVATRAWDLHHAFRFDQRSMGWGWGAVPTPDLRKAED